MYYGRYIWVGAPAIYGTHIMYKIPSVTDIEMPNYVVRSGQVWYSGN